MNTCHLFTSLVRLLSNENVSSILNACRISSVFHGYHSYWLKRSNGGRGFTDCVPIRLHTSQGPDRANFITRQQLHIFKFSLTDYIRSIFWDVTQAELPCNLLRAGFFPGRFFDLEDKGDMFLPNVGRLSTYYTALYPRREHCPRANTIYLTMEWI